MPTPADIPAALQSALADRYDLRGVLGRGGMATVYLTYDRKHRRDVALKVLLPALAEVLGVERFVREIETAARLTHPHILALYDSGEAQGFLYYTMPFVEGGSLRRRLTDAPYLNPDDAIAIARPVADALSYAHRMGVLHRDIKPENILFSQGHPVVADFGIAKAITSAGGGRLTRTGFPIGTPGYMSPEQAAGLTELDVRTDVYSLAVVTYEMLVGSVPSWPTEDAVRARRFLDASAAHRERLALAGDQIEGALVHALAIRLDSRTASTTALIDELTASVPPGRRFSTGDVQDIVKRASELEARTPTTGGAMTIGGVEALAAEVDIAPGLVRRAAESLRAPAEGGALSPPAELIVSNPWVGGPTSMVFERVVEGELPEAEYAVMVDETRRFLKNVGQVFQLRGSFTWATGGQSRRHLQVLVSVRNGRTRITIQENLGHLVGEAYGAIAFTLASLGAIPVMALSSLLHVPFAASLPLWVVAAFATARLVFRKATKRRQGQLEHLAERLASLARELIRHR